MTVKVQSKTGKKQLHTIRSVRAITIEAVEGIVYAKLWHGVGQPTYIPADDFYLIDEQNRQIEIVGH